MYKNIVLSKAKKKRDDHYNYVTIHKVELQLNLQIYNLQ